MTHTVHPYSHRLGILRDWRSRWFSGGDMYKTFLRGDVLLRQFLAKRLKGFHVASVEIERSGTVQKIIIKTARPGMIIGRQGEGAARLKADIMQFMRKNKIDSAEDVKIEIEEMRYPEANAAIVAQMIAEGLEKRLPFRRVIKQMMDKVMATKGVEGARFKLSGRLGGAEMGREEKLKRGMLPLQTFRANIEFARERAILPYGSIGVKVWIYKGEVFADEGQRR